MTSERAQGAAAGGTGEAEARKGSERLLVLIVAFLGLLILVGLGAVLFKILSLASAPSAPSEAAATLPDRAASETIERVALPAGAVVKSVSLSGDRIAVHYEAAGAAGVAVVDLNTGAVVRRLELAPSSP